LQLELTRPPIFQEKHIPADTVLAGLAALVHHFGVDAPVRKPAVISAHRSKESVKQQGPWRIFDSKYAVEPTIAAHLTFAMRHEAFDLLILKRLFDVLPEAEIAEYVRAAPTGQIVRRVWFLYEFLSERTLDVADPGKVTTIDLLDPEKYFVAAGVVSSRHKVRNNLLGPREFCPIVRRTAELDAAIAQNYSKLANSMLEEVSPALIARAASFLLLADSQASFAIEGERLPVNTRERWLTAVKQAGTHPLSIDELNRLHGILIGDFRFTKEGFRDDAVFLGQRSEDNEPIPEFIGARSQDIEPLIKGLIDSSSVMTHSDIDAVVQAAAVAFGFVYIHPYEDGNGRLHRCLVHHALAEKKFSPPGLVFPVSSVMLKWITEYREVLQAHSKPLMPFIRWTPTLRGNVDVKNDTIDLYRFFDATDAAEFLYKCVAQAVESEVPKELDYLRRHDNAMRQVMNLVQMPNRTAENFIMFMRQNDWKLPKRRREDEFAKLTDEEVAALEAAVRESFDGFSESGAKHSTSIGEH
jgi:Fic family protein